jgi:hypothetical protein
MTMNAEHQSPPASALKQLAQNLQTDERARHEREQQQETEARETRDAIARLLDSFAEGLAAAAHPAADHWNTIRPEPLRVFVQDGVVTILMLDNFRSGCVFSLDPADQRVVVRRTTRRGKSQDMFDLVVGAGDTLRVRAGEDRTAAEFVEWILIDWLKEVAAQAS